MSARCVVYGEYPPFRGPAAATTLTTVQTLLADGREVEVVSPRPSAAHRHADLTKPAGAAAFARRLVDGPEVVACFDSTLLAVGGRRAAAARTVLGLGLRRAFHVEIRLSPLPSAPDPGWVRAVIAPADRVVVASSADGRTLAGLGVPANRIIEADDAAEPSSSFAESPEDVPSSARHDAATGKTAGERAGPPRVQPWRLSAAPNRDEIEAEIRRRAERDRAAESTSTVAPSWPLHLLTPLHPAPIQSSRPLFRFVKHLVHRLVAWEIVPIVEQLNHLQRATIEAIDRTTADCQPDGSRSP